jgi:hypothetical protein
VADGVPELGVQAREEAARRAVPAVPEVTGELLQPSETLRDARIDFEDVTGTGLQ